MLAAVSGRVGEEYVVHAHDRRTCRLQLRLAEAVGEREGVPRLRKRVEVATVELIGPTAKVVSVWFNHDELVACEVSH